MSETQSGSKRQGTSRQGTSQVTRSSHGRTAKVCMLISGHSSDGSLGQWHSPQAQSGHRIRKACYDLSIYMTAMMNYISLTRIFQAVVVPML